MSPDVQNGSAEDSLFLQMEQKLRAYNDGLAEEPMFEDEVFKAFRRWQQKKLAEQPLHEAIVISDNDGFVQNDGTTPVCATCHGLDCISHRTCVCDGWGIVLNTVNPKTGQVEPIQTCPSCGGMKYTIEFCHWF